MAPEKKGKRIDMETLPPDPKPIPDSFENVVKPVKKKEEAKDSSE